MKSEDLINELKTHIDEHDLPLYLKGFLDTLAQDIERKVKLEKGNQELKEENSLLRKENHNLDVEITFEKNSTLEIIKDYLNIKKAIEFLIESLDLEVDLDHYNLITNLGTIAFLNVDNETVKELELLKEVLE